MLPARIALPWCTPNDARGNALPPAALHVIDNIIILRTLYYVRMAAWQARHWSERRPPPRASAAAVRLWCARCGAATVPLPVFLSALRAELLVPLCDAV